MFARFHRDALCGKNRTPAEVRSTLQQSLDQWHLNPAVATTSPFRAPTPSASTLDPRGFGETHRQELERKPSVVDRQKADQGALGAHHCTSTGAQHPSPTSGIGAANTEVNPAQLNTNPATLPFLLVRILERRILRLRLDPQRSNLMRGTGNPVQVQRWQ